MFVLKYKFLQCRGRGSLTLNRPIVRLADVKKLIVQREKLQVEDLQITDTRTHRVYTDDDSIIPNRSSVIIKTIAAKPKPVVRSVPPPVGLDKVLLRRQQRPKESQEEPVPDELLCLLCENLLADAVIVPCCDIIVCDKCIRKALLEAEEVCPKCGRLVSPYTLMENTHLRQSAKFYRSEMARHKSASTSQLQCLTSTEVPVPCVPPASGQNQPTSSQQAPGTDLQPLSAILHILGIQRLSPPLNPSGSSASLDSSASSSTPPCVSDDPPTAPPTTTVWTFSHFQNATIPFFGSS